MEEIKIIIATHGDFSSGIKHALGMILGDAAERVETFSLYPGESAADYAATMAENIEKQQARYLFLTDVRGGSVYSALYQLLRYPNVKLFSGTNLPLALEVVLNPEQAWQAETCAELLATAREGISGEDAAASQAYLAHEEEEF